MCLSLLLDLEWIDVTINALWSLWLLHLHLVPVGDEPQLIRFTSLLMCAAMMATVL